MNKLYVTWLKRAVLPVLAMLGLMIALISSSAVASPIQQSILQTAPQPDVDEAAAPDWLEPRPLSIVDLINGGLEPSLMAGSPIARQPGQSLLAFESGSKDGDKVIVNAKMFPTFLPAAYCLGQDGIRDQWPIVVPESLVTITSNGNDITSQIDFIEYWRAGLDQPIRGSSDGPQRYERIVVFGDAIKYHSDGRLMMPANMGCKIRFKNGAADGGNVKLSFEHDLKQYISVGIVDSMIDHEFKSYYWPGQGSLGALKSLNDQIVEKNGGNGRHDRFTFTTPENANYILMVFPPTAVDMYAPLNLLQQHKRYEGSGTYRLRENKPDFRDLSVDWNVMAGIPLNFHTKDRDFSNGEKYLDFFKVNGEYRFHALEVISVNIEYHPCMTDGGCTLQFLDEVSGNRMEVDIYYLNVQRTAPGLTQIPLCSVGPEWSPADAGTKCNDFRIAGFELDVEQADLLNEVAALRTAGQARSLLAPEMDSFVYLPILSKPFAPDVAVPSADCPCGWFTDDGRMLDYVEPPGS